MSTRLFGTDGVRGKAGEPPLDRPTIARLGAALVRAMRHDDRPLRLLVGRDTRESGEWIERALACGACSAGATVTSAGVVPTPAIAYVTRVMPFDAGIVISASHNPFQDTGIKVFSGKGEKFTEEFEREVEAIVHRNDWAVPDSAEARIERVDIIEPYIAHLRRALPDPQRLAGLRVAVDMANGATTTVAPRRRRPRDLRRCRRPCRRRRRGPADVRSSFEVHRRVAGQRDRGHRHEQHRPRSRIA